MSKPLYSIVSPRNRLENRPTGEVTTESVRVPADQTGEQERAIIKLKRTRNSLLNVSKLPPEVLGGIFRWNVTLKGYFGGLEEGSHNFLLVCHHWFEVAMRTPELWSFWGTTPEEWKRCYHHSKTAPLDLVLDVDTDYGSFDVTLHDVLQDRAARDTVRRIYIRAEDGRLLNSIIFSLTINSEGFQSSNLESFVLCNHSDRIVNPSRFFGRYSFPKLQHLTLTNCTITSWDCLTSRTGTLTALNLVSTSSIPTSNLLLILASNPALQEVMASVCPGPDCGHDRPSFRVPLHNLLELDLTGGVRDVFEVLHQLDYTGTIDLGFKLHGCAVGDISQVIGPYLRDCIGRRSGLKNGVELFVTEGEATIDHSVGDAGDLDPTTSIEDQVKWFAKIEIILNEIPPRDLLEGLIFDLLAHTLQEDVIYFWASDVATEVISARFPNLRTLHLDLTPLSTLTNLGGDGESFPSLRHVCLDQVVVDNGDWSPLITLLASRASSGNQLDALEIFGAPHMCANVMEEIKRVVRHFRTEELEEPPPLCPCNACPEPQLLIPSAELSPHS